MNNDDDIRLKSSHIFTRIESIEMEIKHKAIWTQNHRHECFLIDGYQI